MICSKEATYPGHMLIRFWCDSDITFSRGLCKNLVTVLYFSIINVLCGAGGDASFAPQANLVDQDVQLVIDLSAIPVRIRLLLITMIRTNYR